MTAISAVTSGDPLHMITIALWAIGIFLTIIFLFASTSTKNAAEASDTIQAYMKFFYACFVKPHTGDGTGSQQDALESFYKAQADVYDATRSRLLRGREDMLGLVAAQLKHRTKVGLINKSPVWVDIGGGTGYNVEAMSEFLPVPEFFKAVYVVDLSPSLCEMAKRRFERLGWTNVKVVCQDARAFRLHEHEQEAHRQKEIILEDQTVRYLDENADVGGAELITMSYALSMIPEFYPVIDSIQSLLSPYAIIGVCDFYVQNKVDYLSRNYTGGVIDRHCMWISRVFWRLWFEIDRVNLEAARRDYLEYRFGTILGVNARNHFLGVRLPYYIWIGCSKDSESSTTRLAEVDAAATESPYLSALDLQTGPTPGDVEIRSKAYESALINLQSSVPLPATYYQNHHWRLYHEESLHKHARFNNSYIYAFTWEDSRVDARILKVRSDDIILAITSAGDNILSFALEKPRRIHAVDLNPSQNHLLELKVAAFTALGYSDVWKLFGEGRHESFRDILIHKLSPHMSSLAFQFWLQNGPSSFTKQGLYHSGGSGHALRLVGWLFKLLGLSEEVNKLCQAQTLNEQREIWQKSIRKVLHSRILTWVVIGNEKWLWKALGVPPAQRNIIEQDYISQDDASMIDAVRSGHAIHEYVLNTFEPVVNTTLMSEDNHYYLLCLQGKYSRKSHPEYLTPKAHIKLSKPDAFDGLRIHTDEISEVIARMRPGTLTVVVVMDSMDWFPPNGQHAVRQIKALNRAMKLKGRVLLRSAGLIPWYISKFQELGFTPKRVAVRLPGTCIDRVNMYASTWICTKDVSLEQEDARGKLRTASSSFLERLQI